MSALRHEITGRVHFQTADTEASGLPGFSQTGQFKEESAARISESSACSRDTERLVILNFGITKVIPNKTRIPKSSREPLQRKDFCTKTSG